jgi:hypothetical protein
VPSGVSVLNFRVKAFEFDSGVGGPGAFLGRDMIGLDALKFILPAAHHVLLGENP